MALDIETPKGQETLAQENEAVEIFEEWFPGYHYLRTPKDSPSPVDAVIGHKGNIVSVVECKCRLMALSTLREQFNNEWLVTYQKLKEGIAIASALHVPYTGFLFVLPERKLLIQKIWVPGKGYIPKVRSEVTKTQATVNGGLANRLNAFIDMSEAQVYDRPPF